MNIPISNSSGFLKKLNNFKYNKLDNNNFVKFHL